MALARSCLPDIMAISSNSSSLRLGLAEFAFEFGLEGLVLLGEFRHGRRGRRAALAAPRTA